MVRPRFVPPRCTLAFALLLLLPGAAPAADPAPAPSPALESFTKAPDQPVDATREKALYAVGYAHLDTQWRWTYPQVIREFVASTLHDNFRLLDKYPDYIFNFSGSRRYEMMREYYPAEYEKLKGYIAAGRWFPCGSSVDEGDANVPGLEAMVRHVLYGNHYFQKEFGVTSHEFMLPDCFGFPASLPSVLAHCGIKGFSTQKLTWGSAVGIPFKVGRWIGPDGKNVVAALDPGSYGGGISEDLSQNAGWLQRINKTGEMSGAFVDYHYYGTGDRGGAPKENSVQWLERSVAGKGPLRVVSATAERMFDDLKPEQIAKLPEYQGELLLTEHSAGSITSGSYMKRWNRKNELLADAAERASVTAMALGGAPYPAKKLYDAWDLVLGSQMHDMLPGTSEPKAYEYCWNDELLAANQFAAVETDAVGAVASGMDTRAQGIPLVVYNPLSHERDDVVEATVQLPPEAPWSIYGPDGKEVPAQIASRDGQYARLLFPAHLSSVAFSTYDVRPVAPTSIADPLKISTRELENEHYRVTINEAGDVSSIFDKTQQQELLAAPARLEFHYEKPKIYPAWNMDWADRQLPPKAFVDGPAKVRVVENGPVRVALEIEREAQGSRFVQTIRLAAGAAGDRVEFANVIDWQTRESSLKASFPFKNANPLASYDDKLGVPVRGNNDPKKYEVPQHQWFDLTGADGRYGAAVLNDCKFGGDKPDDQTMRLTLLYTPGVRNSFQDQAVQDFGRNEILYAVTGHAGDWRAGGVPLQAARLNQPLTAFQVPAHDGKLGRSFSLLKLDSDQVAVVAIKKAEDSDEIVVRLKETTGRAAEHVSLTGASPITAAREVNGQEYEVGPAALHDGALVMEMGPFALRAFALKFAPATVALTPPQSQPVELAYDLDAVSTQGNRADGGFDAEGRTYPAEQLPARLMGEGVEFRFGPTADGQKNALACHGQTIDLPAGDFDHVYLLAAADGDARGQFKIGDRGVEQTVQDWSGFIGQWDNRLWKGPIPEQVFAWPYEWTGLTPGYVKGDTVAWYASHRHHPKNGNEFYQYCYLFKYGFELPPGARTITLPDEPRIRVFAVSVARNDHEETRPARPLFDTLATPQRSEAPKITPNGGRFDDLTTVSLEHPLYWNAEGWHYTVDGSEPTTQSPVYHDPIHLDAPTTVRTRLIWPDGHAGPVTTARFEVNDTTPPTVVSVTSLSVSPQVLVKFSKPVRKDTAENIGNYQLTPPVNITAARLSEDGTGVNLVLAQPLSAESSHRLTVNDVQDLAPAANRMQPASTEVSMNPPVYSLDAMACNGTVSWMDNSPGLPVGHAAPWTVNLFVRTDKQPGNRTLIAGFGSIKDESGHGRYLSKFANGIHFWSSGHDVDTHTPLTLGGWQMLTATYDGQTLTLYKDAQKIGDEKVVLSDDDSVVNIAPLDPWDQQRRFVGENPAVLPCGNRCCPNRCCGNCANRTRDEVHYRETARRSFSRRCGAPPSRPQRARRTRRPSPRLEATVEADGRFRIVVQFDTLAFALNDTSLRIGNAPMEELLTGPRETLKARLADAEGRFLHGFRCGHGSRGRATWTPSTSQGQTRCSRGKQRSRRSYRWSCRCG